MLNISKSIYIAWDSNRKDINLPEVVVSPDGDTPLEKKRISSMTSKYANIAEHDNIPLPGFTLYETRGYYSPGWFVIDPRGFLVKITSENLQEILLVTGITEGLIQEQCIWARDNSETKLRLIPVNTTEYKDAVANTCLIEQKVDMRSVKRGDKVLLQNELIGTYLGVFSLYGTLKFVDVGGGNGYLHIDKKIRREIIQISDNKFFYKADSKILKILSPITTELTKQEALDIIRKSIDSGQAIFSQYAGMFGGGYFYNEGIRGISLTGIKDPEISIREITQKEAVKEFDTCLILNDSGRLIFEDINGDMYIPYISYYNTSYISTSNVNTQKIGRLDVTKRVDKINLTEPYRYFWSDEYRRENARPLTSFAKFYKIVKHIRNETYE